MNKWAISNKVLRKMLEIAKSKGFGSTDEFLQATTGKKWSMIELTNTPIKKHPRTIKADIGKYPNSFYDKVTGKGKKEVLDKFIDEGILYRGIGGGTRQNPIKGIEDEAIFSLARQKELGKTSIRYHSMHPEYSTGYGYTGDKASAVYKSLAKDWNVIPSKETQTLLPHFGKPEGLADRTYLNKVWNTFDEGKDAKSVFNNPIKVKGKIKYPTHPHEQIPTYEVRTRKEGLPSKFELTVTHNKTKGTYYDLGEMTPSQALKKSKQFDQKSKLFFPKET